jgi:hypothetical protein
MRPRHPNWTLPVWPHPAWKMGLIEVKGGVTLMVCYAAKLERHGSALGEERVGGGGDMEIGEREEILGGRRWEKSGGMTEDGGGVEGGVEGRTEDGGRRTGDTL